MFCKEKSNTKLSPVLYIGDQLHYEKRGSKNIFYFYDCNGLLTGLEYDGTTYYPATTLNGDVVAIYDHNGTCLVEYEYDAWGNCEITKDITDFNLAKINPIRYRGYYYDRETGLYYLQSRYYDPNTGRFLNADGYITTGQGVLSYNMFAYCKNNPVMYSDPSGHIPLLAVLGLIAVAAVGIYTSVKDYYLTPKVCKAVCDVSKDLAKTSVVQTTASICGGAVSVVGSGVSIYNAENARKEKMELMSQLSKDCYNAAFYSNTNTSYNVSYDNYSAFTLQTYNQIVQNSIPMYKQEIELFSDCYSDLGKCEWDCLSGETRKFVEGRFADANASAFASLSTHYASEGAIKP